MRSITSRGTAEINLFFTWNVDMFQTLELVNAALARVQPTLPPTAKITANRLTFAAFPIMGYSLTSDTVPQTRIWELATYDLKPRLNRMTGVSTVVVQGGQEPEFEIKPDPAKLVQTGVTDSEHSRRHRPQQPDRFPGPDRKQPPAVPEPGERAGAHARGDLEHRRQDHARGRSGAHRRHATVAPSVKPVYTIVTANGKPAVLLNIFRQPDSNTVTVADAVHGEIEQIRKSLPPGVELQPFYDQSDLVTIRSPACATRF